MQLWRNAFLVNTTLFFFAVMLLLNPVLNPVYAQQGAPFSLGSADVDSVVLSDQKNLPVMVVSEEEAQQFIWQLENKGYVVQEGTLAQLDQVTAEADQSAQEEQESLKEKKIKCQEDKPRNENDELADEQGVENFQERLGEKLKEDLKNKDELSAEEKQKIKEECESVQSVAPSTALSTTEVDQQQNQPQIEESDFPPEPVPSHEHFPEPYAEPAVHAHVGVQANVSYSGGGNNRDFAKVFFIVAGVLVVAAFVVYAGKYVADLVKGKDKAIWRELIFNSTFLSTKTGRHGEFMGAKLATGFVSDELIQLALVGELGNTSLNLVLNENTNPTPLDFSASYWMLGASARLHLTDKLVNASYLFLELMGGTTSRSATDVIGAARFGASFGLDDHWRLGASLGAQYIGLDEDQGFSNDGDNYWVTYGVEIGARF